MHRTCLFTDQSVDWWSSVTNDWTYGTFVNLFLCVLFTHK